MSISSLRAAVTAAGGSPTQFTHVGLYRELVTALGGTPTKWTIKELIEEAITAAGGTPTRHTYVELLRDLITALGGTPVAFLPDALEAELAALTFFHPSQLFGGADQGFAFDFTDASTLFQNSGGTGAVASPSDPIGYATDLSGKGNHLLQATGANRPLWNGYAVFDGAVDDMATAAINLSTFDKFTIIFSMRFMAGGAFQNPVNFGAGAGAFLVCSGNEASPVMFAQLNGSTGSSAVNLGAFDAPDTANRLYTVHFDLAGATALDESQFRLDGAVAGQTERAAGPAGGGNLANGAFTLGSRGGSFLPLNGRIGRVLGRSGLLSGDDLAAAEQWVAAGLGVSV